MKFSYGSETDTIYAPATAVGRSALAIVRVTGTKVCSVLESLCGRLPEARMATLVTLRDSSGDTIDQGVALYFPAAKSPTGEDAAEFHIHGNMLLVDTLTEELTKLGLRLAGPGEFTRRAVIAGKMDLAQAEAVADLVDAETSVQRKQAMAQLYGSLSDPVTQWRDSLLHALALIEADIDFSDEGDVGEGHFIAALKTADTVRADLRKLLSDRGIGERVRDGFRVVIAGPPNAGKSTLLNCLAGRDVAIVTDVAGTTRDLLEVHLDIGGYPVRLVDTAGMRESEDAVEQIGIARAVDQVGVADIVLWLECATPDLRPVWKDIPGSTDGRVFRVLTQIDRFAAGHVDDSGADIAVSAKTGAGIDGLIKLLKETMPASVVGEGIAITRRRHRDAFSSALTALERLPVGIFDSGNELFDWSHLVLWAEDLRSAIFQLGMITGHARADDVLDRIFAAFCIGK